MTKKEFNIEVDNLTKQVDNIELDDFYESQNIIDAFKKFVGRYSDYLNQNALEHIGDIQAYFDEMKNTKSYSHKVEAWRNGCYSLKSEIQSMKDENSCS